MGKFLIEHDRPNCIGCGACIAVAPEFWEMNDDGKSDVKGGKNRKDGWQEREISEKELDANKQAAETCPVNVIHIKDTEKNKRII